MRTSQNGVVAKTLERKTAFEIVLFGQHQADSSDRLAGRTMDQYAVDGVRIEFIPFQQVRIFARIFEAVFYTVNFVANALRHPLNGRRRSRKNLEIQTQPVQKGGSGAFSSA